ncbi:MAG: hypothetical protein KAQ94_06890 [Arcobacteraceae bacterium]|nr:hypothetical protein [Arcobacteraceae bacterium]
MKKSFSLIELSIAMIVIGIIIAAVMNGRDLIKSSQTKEFSQTFARKWSTIVNSYYDRVNAHLTDGSSNSGLNLYSDGYFDGVDMSIDSNQTALKNQLKVAGINPCKLISTNCYFDDGSCNPTCYKIAGEFTDEATVQIYLNAYIHNSTPTNFIVLHNIPADIAAAVDRLIDGKAIGKQGSALAFATLGSYSDNENMSAISPVDYSNYTGQLINLGIIVED